MYRQSRAVRFAALALAALLGGMLLPARAQEPGPGAGGGPETPGPRDAQEDLLRVTLVGTITAVGETGSFTVVANKIPYQVQYTAEALPGDGKLRRGFRVRVLGRLATRDRIEADRILLVAQEPAPANDPYGRDRPSVTLEGKISQIEPRAKQLRLVNAAGETLRVDWDASTAFFREREVEKPERFAAGETVRIVAKRLGQSYFMARRIRAGGRPGWSNGEIGEVVSVNGRSRELEVDFDGQVWRVALAEAHLRQPGGHKLQFTDLRTGQDVRVTGAARGADKIVDATLVEVVRQPD